MPRARRCSSSCLSAGKGNSFESAYLRRSAEDAGGTGDTPPGGADCGASERMDADADVDADSSMGGCACCIANTPAPDGSRSSFRLAPLSRLTLESVLYLRSRVLRLFVRERRPPLDPVRVNVFLTFCQVPSP